MSAAEKLVFAPVRVTEDFRTERVIRFANAVSGRLSVLGPHKAQLLRALVACCEHRAGALEALLLAAVGAVRHADMGFREDLAREGVRLTELFRGRRR